ncbi:LPS export ABC transporter periplasmic protein LptC [Vibrio vulnificus]|uniref:LPS export ABC transporter periplasmic protein LptC n=1 Tax=Vibrio vulnificus TaxID=672 RepID=UPI0019D4923A|nr:LPS export ABC transporter periplasmic protein LptC [Vibrio vulnificus]EJB8415213.1 LPS export ABC transporter periplasmic protein LptC [Vibrio vulnificus]MBN8091393.1 LPS export ABC transporter periplasmic protein LptC [Vibrio vulnificus]HAS6051697.1 LPS export ABC transporter periplasmic protein LptC [Vibrio vulnificus]HAS6261517.1 LPS export ABC transporter periplasmic protein LptC [Vibrio vulnificus]HAS8439264.1 LPS export ABC transporter periplasmic protein LptC [Vibrio vulnificus]
MSFSRLIYLLLFFVVSWSCYYLYGQREAQSVQVAPNLELPIFSGESLNNISYNSDGIRSHQISSSHLDHYAKSGDTVFENPSLLIYRDGDTIEWKITARRAILSENNVLALSDHVRMQNLLLGANFEALETEKLTVNLSSRDFHTDQHVLMIGPKFETTGEAMSGNLKTNTATLYNHVQGRYEIFTP